MPQIELDGTLVDRTFVFSVMLFPTNGKKRDEFSAVTNTRSQLSVMNDRDVISVSKGALQSIIDAPSARELDRIRAQAVKKGLAAGYILAATFLLHHFEGKHPLSTRPSLRKAFHIVREFAIRNSFGDGTKMEYSDTKLRSCWKEYKSVAHFWAATVLNQEGAYPFCEEDWFSGSQESFETFLGVASGLQTFGETFVPVAAKPALAVLNGADLWRVPSSIAPRHLTSERLPIGLTKLLENYDPRL